MIALIVMNEFYWLPISTLWRRRRKRFIRESRDHLVFIRYDALAFWCSLKPILLGLHFGNCSTNACQNHSLANRFSWGSSRQTMPWQLLWQILHSVSMCVLLNYINFLCVCNTQMCLWSLLLLHFMWMNVSFIEMVERNNNNKKWFDLNTVIFVALIHFHFFSLHSWLEIASFDASWLVWEWWMCVCLVFFSLSLRTHNEHTDRIHFLKKHCYFFCCDREIWVGRLRKK